MFARTLCELADDAEGKDRINRAIAAFESDLPDGKDVRDIIEHFDDYRLGIGRLQKAGARWASSWNGWRTTEPVLFLCSAPVSNWRCGCSLPKSPTPSSAQVARTFHDDAWRANDQPPSWEP